MNKLDLLKSIAEKGYDVGLALRNTLPLMTLLKRRLGLLVFSQWHLVFFLLRLQASQQN
jgi:hypothetical protein